MVVGVVKVEGMIVFVSVVESGSFIIVDVIGTVEGIIVVISSVVVEVIGFAVVVESVVVVDITSVEAEEVLAILELVIVVDDVLAGKEFCIIKFIVKQAKAYQL